MYNYIKGTFNLYSKFVIEYYKKLCSEYMVKCFFSKSIQRKIQVLSIPYI